MIRIALVDDSKDFLKQEYQMAEQYMKSIGVSFEMKMFSSGIELISENKILKKFLVSLLVQAMINLLAKNEFIDYMS